MKFKIGFFIILLYTALQLQAQNFQPIIADSNISFYLDPTTSKIHAVKIDSNYLIKNNQIFELHKTWNKKDWSCIKPNGPSWLGSKFIVDQNGRYLFFNSTGDTVFFYPNTNINTEWLFYTYTNANYVMAKIIKKSVLSFLNITDSIIEISFTEYNKDGILLPVANMQYPIQISKKHGFISMYNWYEMDKQNKPLTLFGMTKYNLGQTFLTNRKVYNFDIGDEFHYELGQYAAQVPNNYNAKRIKRVISKYISANTDTFIYTFARKEFIDYADDVKGNKKDTLINDTIKETRIVREDKLYVPNECIIEQSINTKRGNKGNRLEWNKSYQRLIYRPNYPEYYITPNSSCWRPIIDGDRGTFIYMMGCGLFERSIGDIIIESYEKLVYVNKKDGTLWGTPVKVGLANQGVKSSF